METARAFEDIQNILNFLVKAKALRSFEKSENTHTTKQSHISGYKMSNLNWTKSLLDQ